MRVRAANEVRGGRVRQSQVLAQPVGWEMVFESAGQRVEEEASHAIIKRGFRQVQKLGVEDQFAFGDGIGDGLAGTAALLPA